MPISRLASSVLLLAAVAPVALAQNPAGAPALAADTANDPVRIMVSRLELERYKATVKGLTQFGDRRQGTERNRRAVDWIEAQLKSYGCATERLKYLYDPPPPRTTAAPATPAAPADAVPRAVGGGRPRGIR